MGACLSVGSLGAQDLQTCVCSTGDVVLMQEARRPGLYISKSGTWESYNVVGFIVRDGPAAQGLALVHADGACPNGGRVVVKENLADLLQSGRYRTVLLRRLACRLSAEQADLLCEYADLNLGRPAEEEAPVSLLMARPGGLASAYYKMGVPLPGGAHETLHCSEFVALALELSGLVGSGSGGAGPYLPTHPKGLVMEAPVLLLPPAQPTAIQGHGGSPGKGGELRAVAVARLAQLA